LPEVEDIPHARRQDPMWLRSGGLNPGRDGCRVPLPWSGDAPPFGFSPKGATADPWLPQPAEWKVRTAAAEERDPSSTLSHYRALLRIRREWLGRGLGDGAPLEWLAAPAGVLAFRRGEVVCYANLSGTAVALPEGFRVLIASEGIEGIAGIEGAELPVDVAAWLVAE
jgi:alpha-glucosidase